jgi:hypothetical protein
LPESQVNKKEEAEKPKAKEPATKDPENDPSNEESMVFSNKSSLDEYIIGK